MKKLFLALVAVFTLSMTANAQNNLGVRIGDVQTLGAELSWQHGLGGNRLALDLGWASGDHHSAISLTGIYQWTGEIGSGFGWFAGVGARVAFWSWDNGYGNGDSEIALALAGQAGLEYQFPSIPIQLSLDIRPAFYLIPETHFHWGDIALGIRYIF